jgi:hypothetical protein
MEVYLQQERRIRSAMAVWEPGICLISTELVFGWESRHPSPRDTGNRILNPLLSALFFFLKKKKLKKKTGVFKRLPLYEGTAYILLKKRTYTD